MTLKSLDSVRRILVTGATGNIGSATLAALGERGLEIVAGVSAGSRTDALPPGTQARLCDFRDPGTVAQALAGIDGTLLLVPFDEAMVEWGRAFVAAAQRVGVGFILKVSALGAAVASPSAMGRLHGAIDEAVRDSGIGFCILRCNAFMQNFSGHYAYMIGRQGTLSLPEGNARLAFVDTRDVGAAAAEILANPDAHAGKTYDLDGPEVLTNRDAVEIISRAIGTQVDYCPISPGEAAERYRRLGISDWKINVLDSLAAFIRDGHAACRSADLEGLLSGKAGTLERFARDYRGRWTQA